MRIILRWILWSEVVRVGDGWKWLRVVCSGHKLAHHMVKGDFENRWIDGRIILKSNRLK